MKKAVELSLKVPWGTIAAKAWGNSENTHVLMVHGILDNAGTFDRLIVQLPKNFYYVCIELPGHGLSSNFPPGTPLNYISYILAIRYVLDELQWDRTYYIGHSLGANIGSFFSMLYPERVQKLVLIEGIIPRPYLNEELIPRIRAEHDEAIETSKPKKPRLYTKEEVMYALINLRKCALTTEAAKALFERAVTKVGDDSYYYNRDLRAKLTIKPLFNMNQYLSILPELKVETLIIIATDTLAFLENIKHELLNAFKNFNHVNIIEVKGNHDVHTNYPERISGHISQFLTHVPSKL